MKSNNKDLKTRLTDTVADRMRRGILPQRKPNTNWCHGNSGSQEAVKKSCCVRGFFASIHQRILRSYTQARCVYYISKEKDPL